MNTPYFLNQIMGNLFHTQETPSIPEKYYIGLSASEPIDGICDGEPSANGTGYSRVELDSLSIPENGVIHNNNAISFDESLANWGLMTHYVVYDAKTGGNLLFYGTLSINRSVEANTIITIKAGELSITLSNPVV